MSTSPQRDTIVVIDDDHAMRLSCRKILEKSGFRVETFEDGAQGLEGVRRLEPDLVVVDLKMPGMSGMEVVSQVHAIDAGIIIVVITGYATIDTAVEAMKSGAYDFLPKPFSPDELRLIVNRGLERRHLALESRHLEVERALLKRRFITFVSHQLKTPLVAVHQYLDVLRHLGNDEEAEARRRDWIERCLRRTEEMQELIQDWLTLARLERDTLSRRCEEVDLGRTVCDVLESHQEAAAGEQVTLRSSLPPGGCSVAGDRTCLTVLLDNLVANAIKYNRPGGTVTVSAETEGDEVAVAVADTGIGIPEKYLPFLFEEFFRVKEEGGKMVAGTGLGLAISKKIVSEMGGSIAIDSQLDVGTTFRVRLRAWQEPLPG